MVIWFLGRSSAGKTYIGKKLYNKIKPGLPNLIFLDGDELRDTISKDLGHSIEDRYISEERRSRLCKLLSEQGIHIIMSGLSNAPDIREWNKNNIQGYFEVYLKSNQQTLYNRDPKGIYKKYLNGEINHVVGEDIKFYEPILPWMEIDNTNDIDADKLVEKIISKLKLECIIN